MCLRVCDCGKDENKNEDKHQNEVEEKKCIRYFMCLAIAIRRFLATSKFTIFDDDDVMCILILNENTMSNSQSHFQIVYKF